MPESALRARTRALAVATLRLLGSLPRSPAADIVRWQIGRSATSVAANYRRACLAQSRKDFIAKPKIVEEEVDETEFWFDLPQEIGIGDTAEVARLRREAQQIRAMTTASILTVRRRSQNSQ